MQRVSLARALVRNPTVFLMDEPLSHVDADVRHLARAEIKHMQVVSGETVIYVTHDQVEAVALAERVIVMDLGVIQQIGTSTRVVFRTSEFICCWIYRRTSNKYTAMQVGNVGWEVGSFSLRMLRKQFHNLISKKSTQNNLETLKPMMDVQLSQGSDPNASPLGHLHGEYGGSNQWRTACTRISRKRRHLSGCGQEQALECVTTPNHFSYKVIPSV